MLHFIARNWWLLVLRGICAILSKPYRRADLTGVLQRVPWPQPPRAAGHESGPHQARAS